MVNLAISQNLKLKQGQISFNVIWSILNLSLCFSLVIKLSVYLQSIYYVPINYLGAIDGRKEVQHNLKIKETLRS